MESEDLDQIQNLRNLLERVELCDALQKNTSRTIRGDLV